MQAITPLLERAVRELRALQRDTERLDDQRLALFAHLLDMALIEAREQLAGNSGSKG